MKTTNTKKNVKALRKNISDTAAQLDRMRKEKRLMVEGIKQEEEVILQTMYALIPDLTKSLGRQPTAAEIAAAMDGNISRHEVVGQLLVAMGQHSNGYSYPRHTKNATHTATKEMFGRVRSEGLQVTRRFAEVDPNGRLVEGGQELTTTKWQTTYGVRG